MQITTRPTCLPTMNRAATAPAPKEENPSEAPDLMVGVPTSYLSPRLPFPPNAGYAVSVGVEIAPGLGISLDGRALLVGPSGHEGRTDIVGHLEDGTYPQRDTVVVRQQGSTVVDGHAEWRDYRLHGTDEHFHAEGSSLLTSFSVYEAPEGGTRVESPYAARAFTIAEGDYGFSVSSDWADGERFQVSQEGNVTTVDSNWEDQDFTVTRNDDGSVLIDGHLLTDDFSFRPTDNGFVLQGYHPQQKFEITEH